ncbi:MAG: hypothetical protein U5M50_04010 [Sphingobium sp.]|nr:hypothetical protein [Sphingobium sp.]
MEHDKGAPLWSWALVQDRLVEAAAIQRRMNSGGWPFASDGPWHLIVADRWDWDKDGWQDLPVPRVPPSREQIRRSEEATGWLVHAPERDRRLIVLAVMALASGRRQVPWRALLRPMGLTLGARGLSQRYSRAVTAICNALNGAEMRA